MRFASRFLPILLLIIVAVFPITAFTQQLGKMELVIASPGAGENVVVTDPSMSVLIVRSEVQGLSFYSTRGILRVDEPANGVYHVKVEPGTNVFTISAEGFQAITGERIVMPKKDAVTVDVRVVEGIRESLPVMIRVEPASAEVLVDGEKVDVSSGIKLSIGEHTVHISEEGYVPIQERIEVNENNIFFEFTLEKPKLCIVEVITDPPGAEVSIDGVRLNGLTPLSDFFTHGNHLIEVTLDKYLPVQKSIFIDQTVDQNKFNYVLEPNFGVLTINTTPGAKVYLNGELLAQLSNVQLSPQTLRLRAEKPKCESVETTLILNRGANEKVDLYLDEQTGTIAISVNPPDARIELNGDTGEHFSATGTHIFESIPVGNYSLNVSAIGFKSDKRTFRLPADQTLQERIILEEGFGSEGPLPGMVFVDIPSGSFMMGSPPDEKGRYENETLHQVIISKPFQMMTTEVTQAMWKEVMRVNPSRYKGDKLPVEMVSWYDCQEFIEKLNRLDPGKGYRLPTEAEWEYAAKVGSESSSNTGAKDYKLMKSVRKFTRKVTKTNPVGNSNANALGLYDLGGNVWEWCYDWYGKYPIEPSTDPSGETNGEYRVLRGGSWKSDENNYRPANRDFGYPNFKGGHVGFRLVRNAD
ncbi:SUMF1/EgtB/PvdO family nonheme iron enzyme [bacterium]|nr:SUMF1/EgtB/PvdO family nonheme iron enzyme [bacterium]